MGHKRPRMRNCTRPRWKRCCATRKMRKQMQAVMQKQVESWIHQKIPALGGRTPMQAVRDPDGKEMVEALLLIRSATMKEIYLRIRSVPTLAPSGAC